MDPPQIQQRLGIETIVLHEPGLELSRFLELLRVEEKLDEGLTGQLLIGLEADRLAQVDLGSLQVAQLLLAETEVEISGVIRGSYLDELLEVLKRGLEIACPKCRLPVPGCLPGLVDRLGVPPSGRRRVRLFCLKLVDVRQ